MAFSKKFSLCIVFCCCFICMFAYFGLFLVFCVFEFIVFCASFFCLPFCYLNVLFRIFHSNFNFLLFALHCFLWIIFWFVSLSASLFAHIGLSAHWFSDFHICDVATIVLHPWPEDAELKPTWWHKEGKTQGVKKIILSNTVPTEISIVCSIQIRWVSHVILLTEHLIHGKYKVLLHDPTTLH